METARRGLLTLKMYNSDSQKVFEIWKSATTFWFPIIEFAIKFLQF